MKLFDLEPHRAGSIRTPHNWLPIGKVAELETAVRLMRLEFPVAVPLVDDDGVDLVVGYRVRVQVKCGSSRSSGGALNVGFDGRNWSQAKNGVQMKHRLYNCDVLVVNATDSDSWWVVPKSAIDHHGLLAKTSRGFYEHGSHWTAAWRDAWWVFDDLLRKDEA